IRAGDNDTLFGPQTLSISADGILARNRSSESKIKWAAVQQVAESKRQLFLFTSAIGAVVIPKNCFKSDAEKQAFLQLVDKYRRAG
ncbi:MAG TPA: YcxB family protein, partial [Anaerolineales bacterium]|nr:YcxB family protein [Anaerolineales bacterium]